MSPTIDVEAGTQAQRNLGAGGRRHLQGRHGGSAPRLWRLQLAGAVVRPRASCHEPRPVFGRRRRPAPARRSPTKIDVRVSFVVPAYNEASTIADLLERVSALALDKQIIVVDDGSTDGTAEAVRNWAGGATGSSSSACSRTRKRCAIREAIPHLDGDIVVIQDVDLEYDPRRRPRAHRADPAWRCGCRLRLPTLTRAPAAGVPLLASGGKSLS